VTSKKLLWVVIAALVLWYVWGQVKTTASTATKGVAQSTGYGIGQGLVDQGLGALGKFIGSLGGTNHASAAGARYTSSAPSYSIPDESSFDDDFASLNAQTSLPDDFGV
jgi:hypothetical protein